MKIIYALIVAILIAPVQAAAKTPTILNHLGNDVRYSFTGLPALALLLGSFAAMDVHLADHAIDDGLNKNRLGKFNSIVDIGGEFYSIDSAAVLTFGIGKLIKNNKVALTGETMVEALFWTELITGGLKVASTRTRPDGGNYGFPSGHAARAFAAASVLEMMHGPAFGIPAYLIACAISFSRLDSGAHYASDVIFGAALGTALGLGTAKFHILRDKKFTVMPAVGSTFGLSAMMIF
jgi:membrane-associated phospholipid phosphatase